MSIERKNWSPIFHRFVEMIRQEVGLMMITLPFPRFGVLNPLTKPIETEESIDQHISQYNDRAMDWFFANGFKKWLMERNGFKPANLRDPEPHPDPVMRYIIRSIKEDH